MVIKIEDISAPNLIKFNNGQHYKSYNLLGAHITEENGIKGARFSLWAPNAKEVSVVGDFNNWQSENHIMENKKKYGIWSLFIPNIKKGDRYKYKIITKNNNEIFKADPYAFYSELRPGTNSIVFPLNNYAWKDYNWQNKKIYYNPYNSPMLIYEVHLGSFKKIKKGVNYRNLAKELIDYVLELGYTHIEILPVAEHPLDESWGYQITGYYSVTSRYGTPEDFMYFIDYCHEKGIGVILDWVPAHFCKDSHGLSKFDGSCLYENSNSLKSENPHWGTLNFDFTKNQVWSFLISNAYFWFHVYHLDGLRVDAVASMLYLDYGKSEHQWIPNIYGGKENLEAVAFMKKLNEVIFKSFPGALMIAEESTAWPMVTRPTYIGGLGYNFKWNMGWMNDTLKYMEIDTIHRKWHHSKITFSFSYAFSENYILPLSHDEVVHGKKSLINKISGNYYEKFANLRAFYGYMIGHPGKKLLFMGGEFGQFIEWRDKEELDWFLLKYDAHRKLQHYVKKLNYFYLNEKTLWEKDCEVECLDFIDGNDYTNSVITFMRKGKEKLDFIIVICNFTPVIRENYRIGVPFKGIYKEVFNSDLCEFGGKGNKNNENINSEEIKWHNKTYSVQLILPPLSTIFIKFKSFFKEEEYENRINNLNYRIKGNKNIKDLGGNVNEA
ncbi:1,4-alpha-glucan branching enzyme GlgB [Clostridium acetireducens DSM 10703]|jgi:1,4-alpha-glucan branching enzyme|uniref:1,4-alpha-glucan branching enzyme GlgB n=1 Tax=Clostridium acetireducens DSM 10703 TaxID=1121290 RepID=A0A1E8F0C9_9CLOT|nr:1,4-alpha-glucan branching protein GlgB [Clostridium acetireducens]OFI06763.1 1,4-alpha-glucan branching enzyme GlgB [Clostridium acetireducens DSM 10703]